METSLSDIKDWVTIARPFIDPLLAAYIKPKIEKLSKYLKKQEQNHALVDNVFENKFEQFIARTYAYSVNMNILIFQNQQIKIHDIYHPLTIVCSKDGATYKVEEGHFTFLSKFKRVLVSDSAGMGKSTLTKWITCQLIQTNKAIPILIELRNLSETHNVLQEIYHQINQLDNTFDQDLIIKFLELGNFVILFDGFDEIQPKNQELIIKSIRDFIGKAPDNHFVLTSRPESALSSFGDFQLFNIKSLTRGQSFDLIRKYDSISQTKIASNLIRDIDSNFQQAQELLRNPFLVSLIYCTYTYNKDIPSKKITFYEEIYSALFKRHDLSKDGWTRQKKSKLDIQRFKEVLRQLAFDTAVAGIVVYGESEIIDFINKAKARCSGSDFLASDFLDDLLSAVPLFQREGYKVRWVHKSLQDYFAADFIAYNSKKEIIINKIYESNRDGFLNILELFYELDYKTFRNVIVKPLLEEYISYHNHSYQQIENIPSEIVNMRKSLTFDRKVLIVNGDINIISKDGIMKDDVVEKLKSDLGGRVTIAGSYLDGRILYITHSFKRAVFKIMAINGYACITIKRRPQRRLTTLDEVEMEWGEYYLINDSTESILNNSTNFGPVTRCIMENDSGDYIVWLGYDNIVNELNNINKDMLNEKQLENFADI